MQRSLIIWFEGAGTGKFENVRNLHADADTIEFTYDGVSTQETREAVFLTSKIVGYAITEEEA